MMSGSNGWWNQSKLRDGRHVKTPTSRAQNHMRSDFFPLADM